MIIHGFVFIFSTTWLFRSIWPMPAQQSICWQQQAYKYIKKSKDHNTRQWKPNRMPGQEKQNG
jgi:hypothetical protein